MTISEIYYHGSMCLCAVLSTWGNRMRLRLAGAKVGKGLRTKGPMLVKGGKGAIVIGNGVLINSSHRANPVGSMGKTTLYACRGAKLVIGDNVGISNATIYARKSVTVGNEVTMGSGTKIYDNDFHSVIADYRLTGKGEVPCAPVVLKDRCFIGSDVTILKGVTIGKEAVVGAGSVVTKDVPDGEIWAGVPARFVKKVPTIANEEKNQG